MVKIMISETSSPWKQNQKLGFISAGEERITTAVRHNTTVMLLLGSTQVQEQLNALMTQEYLI